jgi:hypothetical protein
LNFRKDLVGAALSNGSRWDDKAERIVIMCCGRR